MKTFVVITLLAAAYGVYETVRIRPLLENSARLVKEAKPFSRVAGEETLLVLGDSTAVGVGTTNPEDTVAGRFGAQYPEWSIENYAVSGARINDLQSQIAQAKKERYERIVIHIGANDIIRLQGAAKSVEQLEPYLELLKKRSDSVIFVTAGDVGGSVLFPLPLNTLYHKLTMNYHRAFEALAERLGVTYVNLYDLPAQDPFRLDPNRFFSGDGLHPSSDGYGNWFEKLQKVL